MSKFADLQRNIKVNGHIRIYDDNRKRRHLTDGLIFTPNRPYNPKGTSNLYKWKFRDLLSVDFRILPSHDGTLYLACGGNDNSVIRCRPLELLPEDKETVYGILDSNRKLRGLQHDPNYEWLNNEVVILEMTYDPAVGMWRFHVERGDKGAPNYISIVFDTMEAIAENISENEIANIAEQLQRAHR